MKFHSNPKEIGSAPTAGLGADLHDGLRRTLSAPTIMRGAGSSRCRVTTPISGVQDSNFSSGHQIDSRLDISEFDYARVTAGKPWQVQLSCRKRFGVTLISLNQGAAVLSLDDQRQSPPIFAGDVFIAFGKHRTSITGICQSELVEPLKLGQKQLNKDTKIGGSTSPSIFVVAFLTIEGRSGSSLFPVIPRFLWMPCDLDRCRGFQEVLDLLTRECIRPSIGSYTVVSSLCRILVIDAIRANLV
jgi:hypothetical protein